MADGKYVKGTDAFVRGNQAALRIMGTVVQRSLIRFGIAAQRAARPITPVKTGNLRRSYYVRREEGTGLHTRVRWGNTASYAIYVHERVELQHRHPTQAKFMEATIKRLIHSGLPVQIAKEEFAKAKGDVR